MPFPRRADVRVGITVARFGKTDIIRSCCFETQARSVALVGKSVAQTAVERQHSALIMNEAETRAEHIDPALKAAGWGVAEGSRVRREYVIAPGRIEGKGRRGKPLIADYILEYRNTNWPSSRPRLGTNSFRKAPHRRRTMRPSWRCAPLFPRTDRASTESTCRPGGSGMT